MSVFPNFRSMLEFDARYYPIDLLELVDRIDKNLCKRDEELCIDTASNYCARVISSPTPPYYVDKCYEYHIDVHLLVVRYGDRKVPDVSVLYVNDWDEPIQ